MKKYTLIKTNTIICIIITVGFIITSFIGYRSNMNVFEEEVEHISTLAAGGVYSKINKILSEPINVSLTMANDSLLKSYLINELKSIDEEAYIKDLQNYLNAYRQKYNYDSVFLVSTKTGRYYHFDGIDRILTPDNSENEWYYDFLNSNQEYSLNIDNDEVKDNRITVFINCAIYDKNGDIMGIIGVGLTVDSIQQILKDYDEKFDITAVLVDENGILQVSSEKNRYDHINLKEDTNIKKLSDEIFGKYEGQRNFRYFSDDSQAYIVSQYIENLRWYLVVEKDMTDISHMLRKQLYERFFVAFFITVSVLFIVAYVIKKYRDKITELSNLQKEEYQRLLDQVTAGPYENIFEIDITNNRVSVESAERYSKDLGVSFDTPYDQAIKIGALKIKEEYVNEYLEIFLPEHIIETYKKGINNLSYDFLVSDDYGTYRWIRIIAHIFYRSSDNSIRMISYRKNIDDEKKRELVLLERSQKDSMTGLLNKGVTEKSIEEVLNLKETTNQKHAFVMFDIDDFKDINDTYGHSFGDTVIIEFANELKSTFHDIDIVGRIGGDEFAVFMINFHDTDMLRKKLGRLCKKISQKNFGKNIKISCSIGAAIYPEHGTTYLELYEKADQALYYSKEHGKCSFYIIEDNFKGE